MDSAKATFFKLKSKEIILPEKLILLSDQEFRSLGISRQKTTYIKALSSAIINNEIVLESFTSKSSQQV